MSELSPKDEHAEELSDLREDEATSSSTRSGTTATDESSDPTTTGNTSITTLPHGDDTPLDLRTSPVRTRNTSLEALDVRTSPVRNRNTLLVDIVDPSTTLPTRNDNPHAVNVIHQPNVTIVVDPRCNITGSRNQIHQPYGPSANGMPSKCSGNMDPGCVRLDEIYDSFTGQRLYECDQCGCQYRCKSSVKQYIRFKHKHSNQPSPKCNAPLCPYFHTGEKPFKCKLCEPERRFWHENDMEWHYRVHFDKKPFKCDFCGAGFWFKSLFQAHKPAYRP